MKRDELAQIAVAMLSFRRARKSDLPDDLFAEAGWEFLLELFVGDAHGTRLTGRAMCNVNSVPLSVGIRWIKYLSKVGLIVGESDTDPDHTLTLSAAGLARMENILEQARFLRTELEND